MSDHSDHEQEAAAEELRSRVRVVDRDVDSDTLRIMVSTDNHLGYMEKDPIRGNDSFAAFEEVLLLAKKHNCDMVLLAGDLFHENKPSRLTLHKTMGILRKHTMGPNPVQFQITSDQAANFRSTISNTVNYEDPYSSVDLPIFSIHGNHDDPTRDGGEQYLAALDLLAVNHLVNYFGKHDEVDKINVSPVLIRKGDTKVALYGMGSMRDERLNRMWQGKKVKFLKVNSDKVNNSDDEDEEDDEEEEQEWFNIFALHQNRDYGRGSKNCVHESMIPEWMDLVVWGHEHECLIDPSESSVGTFRISQPGSSVATSLSEGESMRKQVGILDIRGSQFRMIPVPLMNVRAFTMGNICLKDMLEDPEDAHIEERVSKLLTDETKKIIAEAREDHRILEEDVKVSLNGDDINKQMKYRVEKPERVLVRLRVEHSGFSTLHNQRFGSQFVNEVGNPSDILLFHRKRSADVGGKKKKSKARSSASLGAGPIEPVDLGGEINVEDIIRDNLDSADKKMQILDEDKLVLAVHDFVEKQQKGTIGENVKKVMLKQRKKLVRRGVTGDGDDDEAKISTVNAIREACEAETQKAREDTSMSVEYEDEEDDAFSKASSAAAAKRKRGSASASSSRKSRTQSVSEDSEIEVEETPKKKRRTTSTKSRAVSKKASTHESSDDEIEEVAPSKRKRAPKKRNATQQKRKGYTEESEEEDEFVDDGDDSEIEYIPEAKATKSRARASRVTSVRSSKKKARSYAEDESEEEDFSGWGVASAPSQSQKSRSRGRL